MQCTLCLKALGKFNGIINLWEPYQPYYWVQHEKGDKHKHVVALTQYREDRINKGKEKWLHTTKMHRFFKVKPKEDSSAAAPAAQLASSESTEE